MTSKRIFQIISLPAWFVERIVADAMRSNIEIDTRDAAKGGCVDVLADYYVNETDRATCYILRTKNKYKFNAGWRVWIPKSIIDKRPARRWNGPTEADEINNMWAAALKKSEVGENGIN